MDVSRFLTVWMSAFFLLIILDVVWLSATYKKIYCPVFKKIQKNIKVFRIWSAIIVWLMLSSVLAFAFQLLSSVHTMHHYPYYGLFLGFIIYGVYNFTNYATLYHYPLWLVVVDTVWGSFVMGTTAFIIYLISSRMTTQKSKTPRQR